MFCKISMLFFNFNLCFKKCIKIIQILTLLKPTIDNNYRNSGNVFNYLAVMKNVDAEIYIHAMRFDPGGTSWMTVVCP